jgi:nicotinamide-nucleotide amidase
MTEVAELIAKIRERGLRIATAESCTGGLLAGALTATPGSSEVFECGVVSYSNESKVKLLGVAAAVIAAHGAVSPETAEAMAQGMRQRSGADIAIAITGIAGPGGGSLDKPVGLVYIALDDGRQTRVTEHRFPGSRAKIRSRTVAEALTMLGEYLAFCE